MEKKILEESSPRGVLDEDCIRNLGSDTGSSKASTSDSEPQHCYGPKSNWHKFFGLLKSKPIRRLASYPPVNFRNLSKRHGTSVREEPVSSPNPLQQTWKNFTFSELQIATNNFSSENLIGKGGYAKVYKGCLQDGQLVAVKRLTRGTSEERIADFLSELGTIVHVNHPNIAKLIGYGIGGGMHLVLQLSPHGSLGSIIHGSKEKLYWSTRYKVAIGTAEGLMYLHDNCPRRIIHRDIKADNILLTEDFEPQICDFGLAKWLPEQWTHHTISNLEGTFGYLAPEYFMHGIVDESTDVFAFGVLLLELISGRRAIDTTQKSLVMWAKPFLYKINIRELADPSLGNAFERQQMHRMALTASLCIQHSSYLRPRMSQVVKLLKGDESGFDSLKQFEKPFLLRTYSQGQLDSDEYNSTRYLNDFNRNKNISFEL